MIYLLMGILAGSVHSLSGPDHLGAVAPLSVENRKSAWKIGFSWGLGHSSGVVLIALLIILLRETAIPKVLSDYSEWLVGVVLIAIGIRGFLTVFPLRLHAHKHAHDSKEHSHAHLHPLPLRPHNRFLHSHTHAIYAVGILHGVSGGSHFIAVIPALALPTTQGSIAYISGYILGTIIAMICFSSALGALSAKLSLKSIPVFKGLMLTTALAALVVGAYWIIP